MTINDTFKTVRSFTFKDGGMSPEPTDLLVETPLEISINQGTQTLIMCTPDQIRELVFGFLFTEGMIETPSDVRECRILSREPGDQDEVMVAHVTLKAPLLQASTGPDKRMSFSSCGVCGKQNYGELNRALNRVRSRHRFPMGVVEACAVRLEECQKLYWRTGGAHAAMLLDGKAEAVFFSEDMGRHNAVDKVIGAAILKGIPRDDKVLISSGRASLEMLLKTARAGIPVFVAMSRPTSRAVEAAKIYNVTLIDLAKHSNRIHSHVRRIEGF
ncbi:MAG: formate dehydrogenase accessory sulfurtransferase FdhD [Desulfatiglandaceae bacterium]|jgi:FdhD protein